MKKLLYFGPSGIGDWCFIYPSLAGLLRTYRCRSAVIILPYPNSGNALLAKHPLVEQVLYLKRPEKINEWPRYLGRVVHLVKWIRRQRFSVLAVSYLSNQSDFLAIAAVSGIPLRIGRMQNETILFRLAISQRIQASSDLGKVKIHNAYSKQKPLDIPPLVEPSLWRKLPLPAGLESDNLVVLAIGGGRKAWWKFWPAEHYRELIRQVPNAHFVLLGGGRDDERQAKKICAGKMPHNVINLVNRIDILTALRIIDKASAVIGNDTGLTNLAAIMKKPTAVLYGPTDPNTNGPALLGASVLRQHRISCAPCFLDDQNSTKAVTCNHRDCLVELKPEISIEWLKTILGWHDSAGTQMEHFQ